MSFLSLASFREKTETLSREAFCERVVNPHLIAIAFCPALGGKVGMTTQGGRSGTPLLPTDDQTAQVFEVGDTGRNTFLGMVTLGRAMNNDVIVLDGSVSNFHAYFRTRADQWYVFDAGSKHGTFIGGARLEKNAPVQIQSGTSVRIAHAAELLFLEPAALYEFLLDRRRLQG